ncbi:MAG TPA: hypothetical protein DEH78_16975 [Solibacterales bacterium]|nr:hypothetical protein [Bryobacterales bacterium]
MVRMAGFPVGYNVSARRLALFAAASAALRFAPLPAVSVCGFHWLTGRICPLCGMTRALAALSRGEWTRALEFHALSPLVLAVAVAVFGLRLRLPGVSWIALAALFAAYWLWRV